MGRSLAAFTLLAGGTFLAARADAQQGKPGDAPAPSVAPSLDGATYSNRLRGLETKVDELKENLRRSQARLALLQDTVLSGGASGCRAEIDFVNDIGSGLDLVGVTITVDGVVQLSKADETGGLMTTRNYPVLKSAVQPGDHTVQVKLAYRGASSGLFSYMAAFRIDVKRSGTFQTGEGQLTRVRVHAVEQGGIFAALEQRPAVDIEAKSEKLQNESSAKGERTTP